MLNIDYMSYDDYEKINELTLKLHKIHVNQRPDLYHEIDKAYSYEQFKNITIKNDYVSLVAKIKEEIVGFIIVSIKENANKIKFAYVDAMYVKEEYRRQNIGKNLISKSQILSKELGATNFELCVFDFNKTAINFYKSLGLKEQRYILEKKL